MALVNASQSQCLLFLVEKPLPVLCSLATARQSFFLLITSFQNEMEVANARRKG